MAIALAPAVSRGSPNVALDDPVYDQLDQLALAGELPLYRGGLAPLSDDRVHELVPDAAVPESPSAGWVRPIERAALRLDAVDEAARYYATAARPRDVAGVLALSCASQEGRPCGQGLGAAAELDSTAGYGGWIAAAIRVRAQTGTARYASALALDRAYLRAELGPIAAEIGRDVLALGPAAHTQLGWSDNPPPLDQLRLSGTRPLALAPWLRGDLTYVLGRLAAPQTYPGDLVSIARAQLDIADRFELGAMQLLELGGDGAPGFGLWDFALEHVRRRDLSAGPSDSSNRRLGFDLAARIAGFGGARITYQIVFEDLRKHIVDAARYDADHALGLATRWLTVEWHRTGVRSYEHIPRTTGFTTGGRIAGDPLGPDAQAAYLAGRIPARWGVVTPWIELAQLSSDTYEFVEFGPIVKRSDGPSELRLRIGARARLPLTGEIELDPEAAFEQVERGSFVAGARHRNAVFRAVLVWRPSAKSATFAAR